MADAVSAPSNEGLSHKQLALKTVPGIGRGWYATCKLTPGTALWSELPVTVGRNRAALVWRVQQDLEKHECFCRPTPVLKEVEENAAAAAASAADGIVSCNYFDCGMNGSMLFKLTSMLNHSCCPNASIRVDVSPYGACRARLVVAGEIAPDEQLCISYSTPALFKRRDERRALLLQRWGFQCCCPRCAGCLTSDASALWELVEEAAAAADDAKPARLLPNPSISAMQTRAAEALAQTLPYLAEAERFTQDIAYFGESATSNRRGSYDKLLAGNLSSKHAR